ncbi:hypothetical protein IJG79_01200 [Candidatus Saccharibacteria bacterium]|nr:hypothetical protein [Candidatus Saccharibacteria bacterium]
MKIGFLKKKGITRHDLNKALSTCKEMTYASELAKLHFREVTLENDGPNNHKLIVFVHNWARALEGEIMQGHPVNSRTASEICDLLDKGGWLAGSEYQFVRMELLLHWKYADLIMTDRERRVYREDVFYKRLHDIA